MPLVLLADAISVVDSPGQMVTSGPASATGLRFTFMVMVSVLLQAPHLAFKIYLVVSRGEAVGFFIHF